MYRAILPWAGLLSATLIGLGCHSLPEQKWTALEALRKELHRQESPRYAAAGFERFQEEFERLRLRYRRAAVQSPIFRDLGGLEEELGRQLSSGESLLADTRRAKEELRRRQLEDLEVVSRVLESLAPTLHPDLRVQLTSVSIQLAQAREFWEKGEYWQTEPLLEQARRAADAVLRDFDRLVSRLEDPDLIEHWRGLGRETIVWSRGQGKPALLIDKYGRRALVYENGRLIRQLPIELGWNGLSDKFVEGDGGTPEGNYRVAEKRGPGRTRYFRALLLDYPNQADRLRFREARRAGRLDPNSSIGGLIEVHGEGGRGDDWTQGCVALNNADMLQLFEIAYEGMPVTIVGRFEP